MNTKDILLAASGENESGRTKAAIGLFREVWGIDGSVRTENEISVDKPIVNIFRHGGYVQVDLKFGTKYDSDLRYIWSMLEDFCQAGNSIDDNSLELPSITLSIIPHQFDAQYYMLAVNPIFHTLQPDSPSGDPVVIRLVFDEEDFFFYEADKAQADALVKSVEEEVRNEIEAEQSELESIYNK